MSRTRTRSYARTCPREPIGYPEPEETQTVLAFLEEAQDALLGARVARGREGCTRLLDHARRIVQDAIREAREELDGPTPYERLVHHLGYWLGQWETWWEDREGAPYRPPPAWWKARQLARLLGIDHPTDPPIDG